MNNKRIEEIDFIKCVLILLMVTFHLVYIGNTYPLAKSFVYTFHMPCFLVLSGNRECKLNCVRLQLKVV